MTHEELQGAYANAIIALVMENSVMTGVDLHSSDERAIVIDALREAIAFFEDAPGWSESP